MQGHVPDGSLSAAVVREQVEKILQSGEFSSSEVLRNLLTFLTNHSLDRPGEAVKEYELAVGVLGRAESFDPRLDSAVRVHTARLRAKLAEYYMSEGLDDAVLIEVPKGSYHAIWRRKADGAAHHEAAVLPEPVSLPARGAPILAKARWFALGFVAAGLMAWALVAVWAPVRAARLPLTVERFWQPFLQSQDPPIVVFSNHRFVGSSATGLRYFREGVDPPGDINDTYSGTGTVMAVAELSNLFAVSGRQPRLKRAELLTWDEAQDANVIFVGAPEANSRLRELTPLQQFAFKSSHEEPRFGEGAIINLHPRPGEQPIYYGPGRPFPYDYAVIAMLPNLHPERKVLILAGTNTYGCQAATELVTRNDLLTDLYTRLGVPKGGRLPDFEALLKVNISGGVPIQPQILIVRRHTGH